MNTNVVARPHGTGKGKMQALIRVILAFVLVLSMLPMQMAFADPAEAGAPSETPASAEATEDASVETEKDTEDVEASDEEILKTPIEDSDTLSLEAGPSDSEVVYLASEDGEEISTLDTVAPMAVGTVNAVVGAKVVGITGQQWMTIDSISTTPTTVTVTFTCTGVAGAYTNTPAPWFYISQPSIGYEQHDLLNPAGSPHASNPYLVSYSSGITRTVTFTGLTPDTTCYFGVVKPGYLPPPAGYQLWEMLPTWSLYDDCFIIKTPQAVTVTYDGNGGGTPSFTTQSCVSDQPFGSFPTVTAPAGTSFAGWYTAPTGGTKVETTTIVGNVFSGTSGTLYAQYTPNTNYVAFDVNGGSSTHATISRQATQALGSLPTPTRANYAFNGWFTAPTGGTQATATSTPIGLDSSLAAGQTLTLYAQWSQLYPLTYNANGGSGGPGVENLVAQTGYLLKTAPQPTHTQDSGKDVVFVGWKTSQDTHIYTKTDTAPTLNTTVNISGAMTVWAVWGYDENGNNIPDVLETKYQVMYDVNGGVLGSGPLTENDILPGVHTLASTPQPNHTQIAGQDVVFMGWSETQDSHVYTKTDTAPTTVTNITIVASNKTVYALWGIDENGNNVPDVYETKYTLTYHVNGGNAGTGPNTQANILTGTNVVLATTPVPTHAQVGGKNVILVGWNETQDSHLYTKTDTAPTTITNVTFAAANKTVYAVWGYDENNNGVPDVLEPKYTLTYSVNGGIPASGPSTETGLLSGSHMLKLIPIPTHLPQGVTPVVFVGWSTTADTHVYTKTDAAPTTFTSITIGANTTVYAIWGLDENNNNIPDVIESSYTVTYNVNGGTAGSGPSPDVNILPGNHTLANTPQPTHVQVGGEDVVFVGWTATQDTHIYSKTDTAPTTITSVNITGNTTVWAVWGYDENKNNIPDVNETKYTVDYDINGGIAGTGPAQETDVLAGPHVLDPTIPTHTQISGVDILFVGWTETPDTHIYAQFDTAPLTVSAVTISGNKTVYAVWGEDLNSNGIPDVIENPYIVTYDVNGGIAGSGPTAEAGVAIGTHALKSTPIPLHTSVSGENVVFIGWTAGQDTHLYTKTDTAPTTITSVTILASDVTVWAVWGYDENKNGIPDVIEGTFTVDYDENGGVVGSTPPQETNILAGPHLLATTPIPTHAQQAGIDVVFMGWTETQDTHVYTKTDIAPTTVTSISVSFNTTVYALWGLDENGNGIPDALETKYTLDYDVNGGIAGSGPITATGILSGTNVILATTPVPTHVQVSSTDVVFIGWTSTPDSHIYAKTDIAPTTITNLTVSTNETVHAVWGFDENGNGIPDVQEPTYTVTYDENGGNPASVPAPDTDVLVGPHTLATSPVPTHVQVGGSDVLFIGWTIAQDMHLYAVGDSAPATVTTITVAGNELVYAVWGYDTNGNGIPDVFETHFTVSYDVNGGNPGTGPANDINILSGTNHTLAATPQPTHAQVSGQDVLFIGWTNASQSTIYTKNDTAPTTITNATITSNKTVYAAWGYDSNSDGIPDVLQTWHTITERHVDRAGVVVSSNTTLSVVSGSSYTGTNIKTIANRVYVGPEYTAPTAASPSTVTGGAAPSITSVSGNSTVYYVYATDNGGGQTPGPGGGGTSPDGIEDVKVDRKWVFISGGSYVAVGGTSTDTQIVNIGDLFALNETDAPAPSIPAGYTYEGYLTDQDAITTLPLAGTPSLTASVADGNRTVYYVYSAIPHTVAYHMVDRNNNPITALTAPPAQVGRMLGSAYGPVIAPNGASDKKVYVGWKESLSGTLKTTPIKGTVSGNMNIYLVYGQDKVDGAGKNTAHGGGPDGIEDIDFSLMHVDKASMSPVANASNYDKTVSWNIGASYSAQATAVAGYVYAGSYIDTNGATVSSAKIGFTPKLADFGSNIQVLYTQTQSVAVSHVDENGATIAGYDCVHTVAHGASWSMTAASIAGYDYQGFSVGGGTLQSGHPTIASVTGPTSVTLSYTKQASNPVPPDHGNYNFVKTPNVKNVQTGETVSYTFSGFGNGWGTSLDKYQIIDKPDVGLDFVSANLPAFTNGSGVTYDVEYRTNYTGRTVLYSGIPADQPFSFTAPVLASGEYFTAITISFGTVPTGFAQGDTLTMTFKVWDNPPASTLNNTGILAYWKDGKSYEFSSGEAGMITLGGFFGLPVTGDNGHAVLITLMIGAVIAFFLARYQLRRKQVK